ncbi:putative FBD-associated F-box protein At5g56390 [Lolium perenne]|uniref:putative FBD-associated F-box protein At5g56390 n=1 Tax=Lolium perenne TaxID=4522 RepID=UPI0021F576E8|nr:putative FBD-associated F-box protein At5g56390 [Lolium perenne]
MDRISDLHDALLHNILLRLRSAPAAARTSVLSRRWRHVWVHLPELVLHGRHAPAPKTSFLNSVDAALAAHSAPAVLNLEIDVPFPCCCLCRANRIAPWLRFASQRLQGKIFLGLPRCIHMPSQPGVCPEELELPPCDGATGMELSLPESFILRFGLAGSFAALTDLTIHSASMEARDLEALVSSQCPRLTTLVLFNVALVTVSGVFIRLRSPSLERLWFYVNNEKSHHLEVAAPELRLLSAPVVDARISAPKLCHVIWFSDDAYDPQRYQFIDAGRHLRQLDIRRWSRNTLASLKRRFDSVEILGLSWSSLEVRL